MTTRWQGTSVLVTGAAVSIGANLVRRLIRARGGRARAGAAVDVVAAARRGRVTTGGSSSGPVGFLRPCAPWLMLRCRSSSSTSQPEAPRLMTWTPRNSCRPTRLERCTCSRPRNRSHTPLHPRRRFIGIRAARRAVEGKRPSRAGDAVRRLEGGGHARMPAVRTRAGTPRRHRPPLLRRTDRGRRRRG